MSMKELKINFILDNAIALFLEKPIADVTIRDVAQQAIVGEATIYRYFASKEKLLCAVATKLEKSIFEQYFIFPQDVDGFTALSLFYGCYLKIFTERRELFQFINGFDAFMLSLGRTDADDYAIGLELFKSAFGEAYFRGIKDGSVKTLPNWEIFYYSTAHAMLELCKKLSAPNIVIQDASHQKEKEIETLIEIILNTLKA